MGRTSTVYLLHFETPYKHAKHYMGSASNLDTRLAEHRSGQGARLMEVIKDAGIDWTLARTWTGGRDVERRLKDQKNAPRLCTVCQGQHQAVGPRLPGWDDAPPFA